MAAWYFAAISVNWVSTMSTPCGPIEAAMLPPTPNST
jgi:hypothetical protein